MKKVIPVLSILSLSIIIIFFIVRDLLTPVAHKIQKPRNPFNIVLITADSFKPAHLGCYGYRYPTSPVIDELARTGVLAEQMINPSGWTNENLISMFTSLYSPVHKVETRQRSINPDWVTPLEILKEAGYRVPRLNSFQSDQNHSDLGFEDMLNQSPEDWLRKHHNENFFLYYHILYPHLPYNPEEKYKKMFYSDTLVPNPESKKRIEVIMRDSVIPKGKLNYNPDEDLPAIEALYNGEIRWTDDRIKSIIKTLEETGIRDRTLIIVTADHGEEHLEHGLIGHASTTKEGQLYDEIIHVPFVMNYPGKFPRGKRIKSQLSGIDLMPTIFEMLGMKIPRYFMGKSFLPVIKGTKPDKGRMVFSQTTRAGYGEPDPRHLTNFIRCVRTGEWKLIEYNFSESDPPIRFELYNLKNDPHEKENLVGKAPEKTENYLKNKLAAWIVECSEIEPPPPPEKFETRLTKLLKSIGLKKNRYDFSKVPPPEWIFPKDGDTLNYDNTKGTIKLRWKGAGDAPYVIEYEVGRGTSYYINGTLKIKGTEKTFGPFTENYIKTFLVVRNPWRARVSPDITPRQWTGWIQFRFQ